MGRKKRNHNILWLRNDLVHCRPSQPHPPYRRLSSSLTVTRSQTLFGNALRETLFRVSSVTEGAKQSFADGVPKQSLGTRRNDGGSCNIRLQRRFVMARRQHFL
jgi:hypothetical protein